jgi:anti-anti-sigma regulatory factor
MELSYEIAPTHPQVTVLHVAGKVDGSNYIRLIEKVQTLCGGDARHLLLDLKDCTFLSSAGLFALHSIALITHHAAPLDPANGWGAMHQMANATRSYKDNFKLAGLQPNVLRTLEVSGFLDLFAIYPDVPAALEAFGPAE